MSKNQQLLEFEIGFIRS